MGGGLSIRLLLTASALLAALNACVAPPARLDSSQPAAVQPGSDANGLAQRALPAPRDDSLRAADPRTLVGLTGSEVSGLLGRPGFVRRDAPAEIWQYRGADCVLDVFLYTETGGIRVKHVELRPRQPTRPTSPTCFAGMIGRVQPASFPGS
jgi:hypothetical protein